MSDVIRFILDFSEPITIILTLMFLVVTLISAFRAGVLKKFTLGPWELEASPADISDAKDLVEAATRPLSDTIPFETDQLARYYAQVLAQSKVSFWFSLVFASLGFFVIVTAAFMYSDGRVGNTVASFVAGAIIDAVAALFFVQSKNAQTSLSQFFDKLRRDRQLVESRKLCDNISNDETKDALRVHLALHYAEVNNSQEIGKAIIDSSLRKKALPPAPEA